MKDPFNESIADIYEGPLDEPVEEVEDTSEAPAEEPPAEPETSHSEADTAEETPDPVEEPAAAEELEPAPLEDIASEGEETPPEPESTETTGEEEPASEDSPADDLPPLPEGWIRSEEGEIGKEIDGEFVSEQSLERGWLRRSDYTRKQQDLAAQRSEIEHLAAETHAIANEIAHSENMQDLLSEYPEVLPQLLANPEATRRLLVSPAELNQFRQMHEVVRENPQLQQRLVDQGPAAVTPEVQRLQEAETLRQGILYVGNGLNEAVESVAREYPEVDKNQVVEYVMALAGDKTQLTDQDAVRQYFGRLRDVFFVPDNTDPRGFRVDDRLIRDRFAVLHSQVSANPAPEPTPAPVEQPRTEEALTPPATPPGNAPGVAAPEVAEYGSFQEGINDLMYGDN